VCRGAATTSAAECTCRRCSNCGVPTNESTRLCRTCQVRRQCPSCERRLPDGCFDDGHLCRACTNRRQRFPTRRTALDVVTEVDLPTTSHSESFQGYVTRNADNIRDVVRDCQNKHRYPSFTAHPYLSESILMLITPYTLHRCRYIAGCARIGRSVYT